ncbi:MAG: UbiA-like polyprenyltransferase [Planctomycetota bacterium]
MLTQVRHLLELIRFSHTIFALPFALLAAVMAWTTPSASGSGPTFRWTHLVGIIVCMVGARSAAMAFNRLVDRHLDAANPRTKSRHLPAGLLTAASVAWFIVASGAVFFAGTWLFLPNRLPLILSVPVLLFLLGYSYAKRFTSLAHFWLGAALMMAPVSAWIALRGEVLLAAPLDALPAVLLGAAVLLWVAGFDIIYACQDHGYDTRAKLRSVPARLGIPVSLKLAAACHAGMLVVLVGLPFLCPSVPLGWLYGSGIAAVATLLIVEHRLVRPDDLTRVNIAFFHVNAVVSIGLFVIGSIDLLW